MTEITATQAIKLVIVALNIWLAVPSSGRRIGPADVVLTERLTPQGNVLFLAFPLEQDEAQPWPRRHR